MKGKIILLVVIIFLAVGTAITQRWIPNPLVLASSFASCNIGTNCNPNSGPTAYCTLTGTVLTLAQGPANGCYQQQQIIQVLNIDFSSGKSITTASLCAFRSSNGNILEAPSSFTTGKCLSSNAYATGQQMYYEFCLTNTACPPTSPYTNTITVVEMPLPSPAQTFYGGPNTGAGTVAFSTLASASTAPTLYLVQPIVQIATYSLSIVSVQGGLSQNNSVTCTGPGTGVTSFSKATYGNKLNVNYQMPVTNTVTAPGGFGWASFPQYEVGGRTLGFWMRIEINANGTGTDMPFVSGSGFSAPFKPTATDAFYISRAPDQSLTKQIDNNHNPVNGFLGSYVFTVTVDIGQLTGTDANVRVNMFPYVYFSQDQWLGNDPTSPVGSINAEATTIGNLCSIKVGA